MTELESIIDQSPKLGKHTKRAYRSVVREYLEFAGQHPSAWSGASAQAFYNKLLDRMPAKSANVRFSGLRYVSKRRAQLNLDPLLDFAGVVEKATVRGGSPPDRRALTLQEAGRLLDVCRGPRPLDLRDFALVSLGLKTGMRRFSMAGIQFEDFGRDRTRGYPFVEITLKGGNRHQVPLAGIAVEAMTPWKRWLGRANIRSGALFRSLTRPGLRGQVSVGDAISDQGVYKALRKRAAQAGIEGFSPHIFRHTFVTWAKSAGVPDHEIAAVTGHVLEGGRSAMLDKTYMDHTVAGTAAADAIGDELWTG
jgi:integrase